MPSFVPDRLNSGLARNSRGFRRRLRRRTGVGYHPRSEFGLRAFGAAEMQTNGNPRDRQDRFGSQTRRHRQFFRIALAADRQILFFPSPANQTIRGTCQAVF